MLICSRKSSMAIYITIKIKLLINYYYAYINYSLFISFSTASTKAGNSGSEKQSLMNAGICPVGKCVLAYALPRGRGELSTRGCDMERISYKQIV